MSSQSYLRIIDPRLAASLSRSYYTALNVIGDKVSAEALVMEAIESLDPENVTGETLRDAVVDVLVRVHRSTVRAISHLECSGGERGIRTRCAPILAASCRFHVADDPILATVAGAHCPVCPVRSSSLAR